jgi:nitrate/TMAO reductase-like tetraheme cytochrome c subunit
MVENNNVEAVEKHCRKLDEQMQEIHRELWESIADDSQRWQESLVELNSDGWNTIRKPSNSTCKWRH